MLHISVVHDSNTWYQEKGFFSCVCVTMLLCHECEQDRHPDQMSPGMFLFANTVKVYLLSLQLMNI